MRRRSDVSFCLLIASTIINLSILNTYRNHAHNHYGALVKKADINWIPLSGFDSPRRYVARGACPKMVGKQSQGRLAIIPMGGSHPPRWGCSRPTA
jgi:hypothetical protein